MNQQLHLIAAFVFCVLLLALQTVATTSTSRPDHWNIHPRATYPDTVVLDGTRLVEAKRRVDRGEERFTEALESLTAEADTWLTQGPWSVTNKKSPPPSGDKHDYASQAPYWWASKTADGCPYTQRDGQRNPEAESYTDHKDRASMFRSSYILSLAWYYTGEAKYATHAGNILRTWFITPATRMNPNLKHAQIIPCANTGRAIGIIDFSQQYTILLDAAAILATGAPGWTYADVTAFHQWNVEYLSWLENSEFGKTETAAKNNHGIYALMQSAGIALFVSNNTVAHSKIEETMNRIDTYIMPDGSQPEELSRTRSWHYSTFALIAYTRLAAMAPQVGLDLWNYEGCSGSSIQGAIDFIIPGATGKGKWKYPEMDFQAYAAWDIVHAAADAGNIDAEEALKHLQAPPRGDRWVLRPAVE